MEIEIDQGLRRRTFATPAKTDTKLSNHLVPFVGPSVAAKSEPPVRLAETEETLVVDSRSSLRPAHAVENKLAKLLNMVPVSASQTRIHGRG